jgi:predicted RNA-binding protein YlxR (DUF448 family)
VRPPEGPARVDVSGTAAGRGGYVHASRACVEAAIRAGGLARALRTDIGQEVAGRLRDLVEQPQERM